MINCDLKHWVILSVLNQCSKRHLPLTPLKMFIPDMEKRGRNQVTISGKTSQFPNGFNFFFY